VSDLAEEILSLISKKGKLEIKEIQDRFCLTRETATGPINFLIEFGFAQLDESKRYIRLSEPCRKLIEEEEETAYQEQEKSKRNTLAVVCIW